MARGDDAYTRLPVSVIKKLNIQAVGARWLYVSLCSHARELQQSVIPRPSSRSLARTSGLLSHPVEFYLKALAVADLVILKDESIEIVGVAKSNQRIKWVEALPVKKSKPRSAGKPKPKR